MVVLFIRAWHGLRIKAQLFSGSVSSERTSPIAPCSHAPNVRTDPQSDSTAVILLPRNFSASFIWISLYVRGVCAFVWIWKGGIWFYALSTWLLVSALLVCWTPECVCGEQGVDKRHLNGGGKCSRGARTPRSGWELAVFVAKLWRFVTNSAMKKTCFKTRTIPTSAEVRAMASLCRSLWEGKQLIIDRVYLIFGAVIYARPMTHVGTLNRSNRN